MPACGRGYRAVPATPTSVDLTLFGPRRPLGSKDTPPPTATTTATASSDTIVLSATELARIKSLSALQTVEALLAERDRNDQRLQVQKAAAQTRKQKMVALAEEARARADKTNGETAEEAALAHARDVALRAGALEKRDEELDTVKCLRGLAAQAEAFALRDRQLQEKAAAAAKQKEQDAEMHRRMEEAWQRDVLSREVEAARLVAQRTQMRDALATQMKARAHQKLLEEEGREQEGMALLSQFQASQATEVRKQRDKRAHMAQLRREVLDANAQAIQARRAAHAQEKEELIALREYQSKKDAELRAREEADAARALAKKARQAELLVQQERVQTNQLEVEERRIQRAAQQKERVARQHEQEEAERRRQETVALKEELLRQVQDKKAKYKKAAAGEEAAHEYARQHAQRTHDRERAEQERKAEMNKDHLAFLKQQVEDAEARRRAVRKNKFDEGEKLKQAAAGELAKLEAIRARLLAALEAKGVEEKYLAHLRSKKLTV